MLCIFWASYESCTRYSRVCPASVICTVVECYQKILRLFCGRMFSFVEALERVNKQISIRCSVIWVNNTMKLWGRFLETVTSLEKWWSRFEERKMQNNRLVLWVTWLAFEERGRMYIFLLLELICDQTSYRNKLVGSPINVVDARDNFWPKSGNE